MTTPTPTGFNDQHIWGGPLYRQQESLGPTGNNRIDHNAQTAVTTSSQVGIIASNSDDVFHPSSNVVSSNPYILPDIPSETAYNRSFSHQTSNTYIPVNRAHLSQPLFPPPQQN
jgi:hypothetical protein